MYLVKDHNRASDNRFEVTTGVVSSHNSTVRRTMTIRNAAAVHVHQTLAGQRGRGVLTDVKRRKNELKRYRLTQDRKIPTKRLHTLNGD